MKVIGAGLPRTATTTTLIAFEQLGFGPCYHMRDLLGDLHGRIGAWEGVVDGTGDLGAIVDGYQSSCDFPSARYYRELAERYPDAKVVLSVRSGEGWARSMSETILPIFYGDAVMHYVNDARRLVDDDWRRYLEVMEKINFDEETGAMRGAGDADEAGLVAIMERWNDEVRATIAPERLLVWNPGDGWEPLCEFLEVAVPDGPVPNVNDTAAFREGILGGGLAVLNGWWDQRDRPSGGLHGAALS